MLLELREASSFKQLVVMGCMLSESFCESASCLIYIKSRAIRADDAVNTASLGGGDRILTGGKATKSEYRVKTDVIVKPAELLSKKVGGAAEI